MNAREVRGVAVAAVLFLLVQVGALAMVGPFDAAGYQAVEDPSDPTNTLVYIVAILVATALMLAAFKYAFEQAVKFVVLCSSALVSWYVFAVIAPPLVTVWGLNLVAIALSVGVAVALLVYPEWYVIDSAGVVMGIGAGALFGISFGLLPAILLLSVLAVYDAISVYGTEHMLSLAEGVMELRIPVILVVLVGNELPLGLSYAEVFVTVAIAVAAQNLVAVPLPVEGESPEALSKPVVRNIEPSGVDERAGQVGQPD